MKVFNLGCEREHEFEGWFASADAYESQLERSLIECPVCGTHAVRRLPSAPRLNLSGTESPSEASARQTTKAQTGEQQTQAAWLKMARYIRENTEDVGERFADEARRIHYDETPARAIRGVASRREASELADEGIEVFTLPMPKGPSGPLQ
ncbi:MAG: DUF1178 family protein [Burkholderiaceae bacterium]|nr:DUF1178 family protein [Burkholderiaceae bacterium]